MGNDRLWMWQFAPVNIYTPIDNDMPLHSMKTFVVKIVPNLQNS